MNPVTSSGLAAPTIRRATLTDLPRMGELGALLVETHHAFDSQRFIASSKRMPGEYASFLGAHLDEPAACIFVAEDKGDVIGYVFAVVEGPDFLMLRGAAGVVHDLIVGAESRGRGAARLLLEAVLAELRARGVPRVVLSTAVANEVAQRLFASLGFRRTMIEMTCEFENLVD